MYSNELAELDSELRKVKLELEEALHRQAATEEILRVINSSPNSAQPVFEAIVNAGLTLFPEATISIALEKDGHIHAAAIAGADADKVEDWRVRFPYPISHGTMHGYVVLEGQVVDVPDVSKAADRFAAGMHNFLASGYQATTMMPIFLGDRVAGVLAVLRLSTGRLTQEQYSVLQTFAAQANTAVNNTQRMNELRRANDALETVSNQLAKYISPQLYQSILRGDQEVKIDSKRKKLTIFFSDIADFTKITDRLESEELTALLNEYLTEMSKIAQEHGAYFDKFVGDAMMFYFGDPETLGVKKDAESCVKMAVAMQRRLLNLQTDWQARGLIDRPFEARMGINTGFCTVGNFGSEDRMDYTIIGGEVNLAARLESHADVGGILMAAETCSHVNDLVFVEERNAVTMKGFPEPIRTFSVVNIHNRQPYEEQPEPTPTPAVNPDLDMTQLSDEEKSAAIKELESTLAKLKEK
jgi:class 3 adenylate cyclase